MFHLTAVMAYFESRKALDFSDSWTTLCRNYSYQTEYLRKLIYVMPELV
jgi:hypothetical protein